MPYLKLTIPINEAQFDDLEALLSSSGAVSVTMEDAGDQPILEPKVNETPLWHELKLSALFNHNINQKKLLNKLKTHLTQSLFERITLAPLADEPWELKWLEYFSPISFGNDLWIGTHQHQPETDYRALVYLEPGMAFGTGTHPSTYLCLEWLAHQDLRGKTIIDYGSGSGILAIAAAKLGAGKIIAVDNDPQALTATQNNATKNKISLHTYLPDELPKTQVDLVLANILANPLMMLAPTFVDLLKPQGELLLAGILDTQADAVKAAYTPQISWLGCMQKEEWIRLYGIKSQAR